MGRPGWGPWLRVMAAPALPAACLHTQRLLHQYAVVHSLQGAAAGASGKTPKPRPQPGGNSNLHMALQVPRTLPTPTCWRPTGCWRQPASARRRWPRRWTRPRRSACWETAAAAAARRARAAGGAASDVGREGEGHEAARAVGEGFACLEIAVSAWLLPVGVGTSYPFFPPSLCCCVSHGYVH